MSNTAFAGLGGAMPAAAPTRRFFLRAVAAVPAFAIPAACATPAVAAAISAAPNDCPDLPLIQAGVEHQMVRLAVEGCLSLDEDHPRLDGLYARMSELESQIGRCAALTLAGIQEKGNVLRSMIFPVNKHGELADWASEKDAMIWSLLADLRRADPDSKLLSEEELANV